MTIRERQYYWLVAKDEEGKTVLIFGSESESEARQKGLEMLGGLNFDIRRLPTRNLSRASSLLKGNRLERTHDLKEATKRLSHERGLRQSRKRRRRHNDNYPGRC